MINAFRHGGWTVKVTATKKDDWVLVGVTDDGPGLPETEWERIFDAYHSAHPMEGKPASVGLGLTVSRALARLMGGDIRYRHDEHTSLFEFRLPVWTGDEHVVEPGLKTPSFIGPRVPDAIEAPLGQANRARR